MVATAVNTAVATVDEVVSLSRRKAVDRLERLWRFHEVDVKTAMWQQGKVAAEAIETGCGDELSERVGITIGELRRYARIYNLFSEADMSRPDSIKLYHKIAGPMSSVEEYVLGIGETDTASFWLERAVELEMTPHDAYRAIRMYYGMVHAGSWWYASGSRSADEYKRWLRENKQHISSEQTAFTRKWIIPLAEIRQASVVSQEDVDRLEHQLELMGELPNAFAVYAEGGLRIIRHLARSAVEQASTRSAPQQPNLGIAPSPQTMRSEQVSQCADNGKMTHYQIVISLDSGGGATWGELKTEAASHGIVLPDKQLDIIKVHASRTDTACS